MVEAYGLYVKRFLRVSFFQDQSLWTVSATHSFRHSGTEILEGLRLAFRGTVFEMCVQLLLDEGRRVSGNDFAHVRTFAQAHIDRLSKFFGLNDVT
jgi:hypothetical protein